MLIELLRRRAAEAPDHPFAGHHGSTVTYRAALARSEALAEGLRGLGKPRLGCLVGEPVDLALVLIASTAAGIEACPYAVGLEGEDLAEQAASLGHEVLVTDRPTPPTDRVRTATLDHLASGTGPAGATGLGPTAPPTAPSTGAPTMILTTGTTGRPKGARHDWGRLASAVRADRLAPTDRWLLAYNLNQFAGLQVLLHVLVGGSTLVVPASNQPRDALEALRDERVTHASGTPTFWRFVAGFLHGETDPLPALRQLTLGGEAVPGGLLDDLRALFPSARLSQVYASTELGSSVSVGDGQHGLPVSVLERADDAEVRFRIVDGELQARSRVGMLGYHHEPGDGPDDGWWPTGDLVEIRAGRIHFVGRTTEVINVGGVKVHPLPVEDAVGRVPGVLAVRAFGKANPMTGQIVALDVVAAPGADDAELEALEDAVRAACAGLPPAARPRRVRFVDELEVRGGKVVRAEAPA